MIKKGIRGQLEDGTRYNIREDELIINNKIWFKGTKEEIERYIEKLNKQS